MPVTLAKLTSKNQLTLPKRVVEELDYPSHFEVTVLKGTLILWPGRIVSLERQAEAAGIPPKVLRRAVHLVEAEKAAKLKPGS
ncbi:MAG: hypothetical protein JWR10_1204 [Rubritepida sp.]|nr:hypothetical protein [Rubritepida sp.]